MTIRLAKFKARLLANPKVKSEYDALASEFEIAAELETVDDRSRSETLERQRRNQSSSGRKRSFRSNNSG